MNERRVRFTSRAISRSEGSTESMLKLRSGFGAYNPIHKYVRD